MICAGIDAGSRAIKIVLIDAANSEVVAKGLGDQGVEQERLVTELFEQVLENDGVSRNDIGAIVATGYGRNAVSMADTTPVTPRGSIILFRRR
jgi:activator of 2-hydroxyglutaryl-CoA dehydratase